MKAQIVYAGNKVILKRVHKPRGTNHGGPTLFETTNTDDKGEERAREYARKNRHEVV